MIRLVPGTTPRGRGEQICPPRGALIPPALVAALLISLTTSITAAASLADGDPASDYLLSQNVYLGYQSPSPGVSTALERAADDVYRRGDRVKVALIYAPSDLGSIPSLFGNPANYARFLGIELGYWYIGPVLIAMPAGFGIYDGGRSITAEQRVLQAITVSASSPDALAESATAALHALGSADALHSPDIRAPLVTAYPASARRGKRAHLRFDVFDDSGRSTAVVRVYEDHSILGTLASPPGFMIGTRSVTVSWLVPARLRSRRLRFCVVATDPAGNQSTPACAPFLRVS